MDPDVQVLDGRMPAVTPTTKTSMHHPRRRNVTSPMVGLKNGHIRKNFTQNGEPRDIAGRRRMLINISATCKVKEPITTNYGNQLHAHYHWEKSSVRLRWTGSGSHQNSGTEDIETNQDLHRNYTLCKNTLLRA